MTRRLAQYLYVHAPLEMECAESELPDATTLTLKLCPTNKASRATAAIAAGVSVTVSAADGKFTPVISASELNAALGSGYVTKRVWGYLYDDAGSYFDVFEFVVTDVDPDLMRALTA